jgi:hypothetical protein
MAALTTATTFTPIINALGAKYFPKSGFTPLQPKQIRPVYLPAWFVDAEVNAKLVSSSNREDQQVTFSFQHWKAIVFLIQNKRQAFIVFSNS